MQLALVDTRTRTGLCARPQCQNPLKRPSRQFCSNTCSRLARPSKIPARPAGWHVIDGVPFRYRPNGRREHGRWETCEACDKQFPVERGLSHQRKFCSRYCGHEPRRAKPGQSWLSRGYVYEVVSVTDPMIAMSHRRGVRGGNVLQHRLVMGRELGRPLRSDEQVHHINGNRSDNRIENLQLRVGGHGAGQVARCLCCGSQDIAFEEIAS